MAGDLDRMACVRQSRTASEVIMQSWISFFPHRLQNKSVHAVAVKPPVMLACLILLAGTVSLLFPRSLFAADGPAVESRRRQGSGVGCSTRRTPDRRCWAVSACGTSGWIGN